MAGTKGALCVPLIHVLLLAKQAWMRATIPGSSPATRMTQENARSGGAVRAHIFTLGTLPHASGPVNTATP
jgi:hypothetical protein